MTHIRHAAFSTWPSPWRTITMKPVRPDKTSHAARGDLERQTIDGPMSSKVFAEPFHQSRHRIDVVGTTLKSRGFPRCHIHDAHTFSGTDSVDHSTSLGAEARSRVVHRLEPNVTFAPNCCSTAGTASGQNRPAPGASRSHRRQVASPIELSGCVQRGSVPRRAHRHLGVRGLRRR